MNQLGIDRVIFKKHYVSFFFIFSLVFLTTKYWAFFRVGYRKVVLYYLVIHTRHLLPLDCRLVWWWLVSSTGSARPDNGPFAWHRTWCRSNRLGGLWCSSLCRTTWDSRRRPCGRSRARGRSSGACSRLCCPDSIRRRFLDTSGGQNSPRQSHLQDNLFPVHWPFCQDHITQP